MSETVLSRLALTSKKKSLSRGIFKIRFIKQPNKITKENIRLLHILDAISNIKEIPDTTVEQSCKTLSELIKKINTGDKETFIRLAKNYNPATRALSGAILENSFGSQDSEPLLKTLNPSSVYKFEISESTLPNKRKWNIL